MERNRDNSVQFLGYGMDGFLTSKGRDISLRHRVCRPAVELTQPLI